MRKWLADNKKLIVFIIYAVVTFSLVFIHRNWRDEAQAWLLARDCNILELIRAMRYEGHMLLWYLILMPFAKLGFPYMTTNIISWLIMCVTVWLILDKAPFRFIYRVLLILFFPFWYLYPVISRCYCLIPLAIVLTAICYKDRKDKPKPFLLSVAFLANTHVVMLGMVGLVLLDFLVELFLDTKNGKEDTKKRGVWLAITVFIVGLSVCPLLGCLSTNGNVKHNVEIMKGLKYAIAECPIRLVAQAYMLNLVSIHYCVLESVFIFSALTIALVLEMRMYLGTYLRVAIIVLYQCLIYSFIWYATIPERASIIILIVLYYKWINKCLNMDAQNHKSSKRVIICYLVLLLANVFNGFLYISNEINCKASYAYQMGEYINDNLQQDSIILSAKRTEFTTSVIPYVKKNIKYYHVTGKRYFTYTIWDRKNHLEITQSDIESLKEIFGNDDKLYYLYSYGKQDEGNKDELDLINKLGIFTPVYSTKQKSFNGEDYILYKVYANT